MNIQNYLLNTSLVDVFAFFVPRLIIAIICGTMIGFERELKGRSAGLKTCILICIGATIFSSIAALVSNNTGMGDPTRIAAQIVSGIGFLGGGAIIHSRGSVYGITTAATIWIVGAIGVAIGIELYPIAIMTSVVCVIILVVVQFIEERFTDKLQLKHKLFFVEFITNKNPKELEELYAILHEMGIETSEVSLQKENSQNIYSIKSVHGEKIAQALSQKKWLVQMFCKPL